MEADEPEQNEEETPEEDTKPKRGRPKRKAAASTKTTEKAATRSKKKAKLAPL
jgi:hypothetical protein